MKKVIKKIVKKAAPGLAHSVRRVERIEQQVNVLQNQLKDLHDVVSSKDQRLDELRRLIAEVEPYQPTYGISGLVDSPRRSSRERCITIESYLRPVTGKHILDIGSSLGFFSYYFADRGAYVEGWEENVKNAEVARRIGALNGLNVDFRTKEFNSETVTSIPYDKFDAAFILSVFHHIIRFNGLPYTQELVKSLMDRVPVLIVELAKKGEDPKLPWDASQPEDELAIFDLVRDEIEITKLGDFGNHLSSKTRPLYAIQKKKTVKVQAHTYEYESVVSEAYKDSPVARTGTSRRYFFGKNVIVKDYAFSDEKSRNENLAQILNEIKVFLDMASKKTKVYHVPSMVDFEIDYPMGAKIVVERLEGELASDVDFRDKPAKIEKLIKDVLHTLADLESHDIHHNDIRSWNIIIDKKGGAWLIDFGLSGSKSTDDDCIALLRTAYALLRGERESYASGDLKLPPRKAFAGTSLEKLYDLVDKGERSPRVLREKLA